MINNVILANYPISYTEEQKEKLEESIRKGIRETGIVLVPKDVEVVSLPLIQ